ncbi:glucosaminidase domain-containing protein [Anaerostipes caccae]|uniref:glucosaminidase domain-containing protein n=1 Tax=Anaerostipes caccae TaxID=105841 RepID=UPI0023E33ECB|nr:glucosaminidase domain-containing protein [Anaerostipes caccae]
MKKDGNDTQIGHRVNHLLLELSVKTKNGYLKDIAENYNFDVAGEMKVADVIEDEETIQLKQYLDQQILNCDKTQEQRLRELKKSRKKIRTLKKQIKELKADEPRVFDPMNLLKKSNLSVEEIRLMLKGSALEEEAPAFYKCEKKYGVNAVVVMGIAIHESAWGTSRRAREDHNLTGYGVTSDSAKGINAPTKEENLLMTAKLLKEKYLVKGGAYYHGPTVKGVNQCYCVGNTWAGYVTNRCYEIMKRL